MNSVTYRNLFFHIARLQIHPAIHITSVASDQFMSEELFADSFLLVMKILFQRRFINKSIGF